MIISNQHLRLYHFVEHTKYILPYREVIIDLQELFTYKSYGI